MADTDIIKRRLDTSLESEAAEFLVLAWLMLHKIPTFKAYVNYPGYDLIATNAEKKTSAKIQVKSRFVTDWDGFIIKNYECDFVVFVALNRGYYKAKKNGESGVGEPEFYVLPVDWVKSVRDPENRWGKIVKSRLAGIQEFKNRWELIAESLNQ